MGANTTDHIYVNVDKLHLYLHLFFGLDSYSYNLAQYPVLSITHNYLDVGLFLSGVFTIQNIFVKNLKASADHMLSTSWILNNF